ncbi:F-box domain containing protein [Tanacetum coccineum]|uniref:F-box domain containing protein n=1 Tax=Tanacetum coccineum TaxID=301880 RepID=A0ABQ4Z4J1_9ASTR
MGDLLPDDIVRNILAWLPAKPLLRFQGVSKYWNNMLKEPYFMKLRSRRTIILPLREALTLIDDNVPTDDTPHLVLKRCCPLENLWRINAIVWVIRTFNGIVLLAYRSTTMILYNPFTGASKKLPCPPISCTRPGYGFGYGASPDDLKIVRLKKMVKAVAHFLDRVNRALETGLIGKRVGNVLQQKMEAVRCFGTSIVVEETGSTVRDDGGDR